MSSPVAVNTKNNIEVSRRVSVVLADLKGKPNVIFADTNSEPPTEFELLKVGMWRTPWHGDIMIMPDDLQEYVDNYKAGYAVSGNGKLKLPINYGHESWEKAAGWFVPAIADDGVTLMATQVEWTPAAAQAIKDGEWKCISAEFCPAGRGGWCDPLDEENYIDNVLEGAALTNIPLFSNLEPVMASATFGKDKTKPNVFLITASEHKETSMTLEEVTKIENDKLTDEQRAFLVENKDELNAEQRQAYGFEVKPVEKVEDKKVEEEPEVPQPVEDKELAGVAASIKSGEKMLVDSKVWASNQKKIDDLTRAQIKADVLTHVARGAIKADQESVWTDKIMADASMADILKDLPSNPVLADTQGSDANAGDATDPIVELQTKAKERVAAAAKENRPLTFAQAQDEIMREDKELKDKVEAHRAPRK